MHKPFTQVLASPLHTPTLIESVDESYGDDEIDRDPPIKLSI